MQTIFADAKSQDLYNLFKGEGQQSSDEARYRETAAKILGDLEHIFRVEMVCAAPFEVPEHPPIIALRVKSQLPHLSVFTVQLLGKDDPSQEDPEFYIDRWRSYITSYTSVSSLPSKSASTTHHFVTIGTSYKGLGGIQEQAPVPSKVGLPQSHSEDIFLYVYRNRANVSDHPVPTVVAGNALEMKICVRTYRIFYVSNTADFFYKPSPPSLAGVPRRRKGGWFEKLKAGS